MNNIANYLLNNMEVTTFIVNDLNAWDGCLEYLEYFNMEDLDAVLEGYSPSEIANKIFCGDFNPNEYYFRFDAYGNLESMNMWEIVEEYRDNISEIVRCLVAEKDNIDIYDEELEELLEQLEEADC